MVLTFPITLTGDNLGKRHKQINYLVKEVYDANDDFKNIQDAPEESAIDRLFKIDLASKSRNVDYILMNLKDSDMLYVSRALKSKWLLGPEYECIINPDNLENHLYPHMVTTAVTKTKHWVLMNLRDERRSEEFYEFYSKKEFELAMKFLARSSKEFIEKVFPTIVTKLSPKHFKILCERTPQVAKMFFDLLESDESLTCRYLNDEKYFFNSIKCVLKSDSNLYLDITEKYFNANQFSRFSSIATNFIMAYHKDRFWNKPELYTAWILNTATLAETLNVEEVKDLVKKLARASYLNKWYDYKAVEPLIKRLKPEERAAFKKIIFVQKDIGHKVEEWPYEPPSPPQTENFGPDIFEDRRHEPYEYSRRRTAKRLIRKKCCKTTKMYDIISDECQKVKTVLDKLFDEYRFCGFEKTFYELRKRILAESSPQNRQFIMLVLISKTGGRADAIASLMELLARHSNEPPNLRATIIRSLVKRAFIWRLPEETWKQLLQFGQGLGLDGSPPEADCFEGLHSVFIRSLLQTGGCNDAIFKAFLEHFCDLTTYDLTVDEKKQVSEALANMLHTAAKAIDDIEEAVDLIIKLVEVLRTYKIKVETYPGLLPTIVDMANKNLPACTYLLENFFKTKIGRKELFQFTYKLIKTDDSHLNALKHDIAVLEFDIFYESCINENNKFDRFFRKIALYFNENGGLAMQYRNKLKEKEHNRLIARPLAILLGNELEPYLLELDKAVKVESKVFASSIRANEHRARPGLNIDSFGWKKAGVKMIANKVISCPTIAVEKNIQKLLVWKRTARIALVLSKRTKIETDVFIKLAKLRPTVAIKLGIKHIRKQGESLDMKVWEKIKPLIQNINFYADKNMCYVQNVLTDVGTIPMKIKPEYSLIIYKAFDTTEALDRYDSMPYLCYIEHILSSIDEEFIENLVTKFLENDFTLAKITQQYRDILCDNMFIRIIFTYILLSKSEGDAKRRFDTFGKKILDRMTEIYELPDIKETFLKYLDEILLSFKNTKVFLSIEYVSPLPVMEKTVGWMQTILPIEEYLDKYISIHLTMLYYKAIRQTVKEVPKVFEDDKRKYKEGVKIVGNLFGKYIAREVGELMTKYFESIWYLYKDALVNYLDTYFNYVLSSDFLSSIINGIFEEGKDDVRLGMYLLKEKYHDMTGDVSSEIKSRFGNETNIKSKFFVYNVLFA